MSPCRFRGEGFSPQAFIWKTFKFFLMVILWLHCMLMPFPFTRGVNYICKVLKLNKAITAKQLYQKMSVFKYVFQGNVNLSFVLGNVDTDIFFWHNQDRLIEKDIQYDFKWMSINVKILNYSYYFKINFILMYKLKQTEYLYKGKLQMTDLCFAYWRNSSNVLHHKTDDCSSICPQKRSFSQKQTYHWVHICGITYFHYVQYNTNFM